MNDPYYKPLMGADVAAIKLRGRAEGRSIRFEGSAAPVPGAVFWANMTRLDDEDAPPVGSVGRGGIVNGLYSVHIRTLDGIDGGLSGVMLLIDGRILGGDAFFYYLGPLHLGGWPLERRDRQSGAHTGEGRESRVRRL